MRTFSRPKFITRSQVRNPCPVRRVHYSSPEIYRDSDHCNWEHVEDLALRKTQKGWNTHVDMFIGFSTSKVVISWHDAPVSNWRIRAISPLELENMHPPMLENQTHPSPSAVSSRSNSKVRYSWSLEVEVAEYVDGNVICSLVPGINSCYSLITSHFGPLLYRQPCRFCSIFDSQIVSWLLVLGSHMWYHMELWSAIGYSRLRLPRAKVAGCGRVFVVNTLLLHINAPMIVRTSKEALNRCQ